MSEGHNPRHGRARSDHLRTGAICRIGTSTDRMASGGMGRREFGNNWTEPTLRSVHGDSIARFRRKLRTSCNRHPAAVGPNLPEVSGCSQMLLFARHHQKQRTVGLNPVGSQCPPDPCRILLNLPEPEELHQRRTRTGYSIPPNRRRSTGAQCEDRLQ